MWSLFEIACERCNSDNGNSACEAVVGELRAKLLRLAATPPPVGAWPPPNGGNGVIRGVTRRRHAASHLLMLQNPHRRRCGRYCEAGEIGGDYLAWPRRGVAGDERPVIGDMDGAERTQDSPNKNRAGPLRYKTRPAHSKWPNLAHFSHAWRTFSCIRRDNMATLKPPTPLQPLIQASMKPPSPLHLKTAPKTPFLTRKGDGGFNPPQAQARKGDRGFRQPGRLSNRAWLRCPWAVAVPGWAIHSDPAPLVWKAPEGPRGQAAVPVGGGGAWLGYSQ